MWHCWWYLLLLLIVMRLGGAGEAGGLDSLDSTYSTFNGQLCMWLLSRPHSLTYTDHPAGETKSDDPGSKDAREEDPAAASSPERIRKIWLRGNVLLVGLVQLRQ